MFLVFGWVTHRIWQGNGHITGRMAIRMAYKTAELPFFYNHFETLNVTLSETTVEMSRRVVSE